MKAFMTRLAEALQLGHMVHLISMQTVAIMMGD